MSDEGGRASSRSTFVSTLRSGSWLNRSRATGYPLVFGGAWLTVVVVSIATVTSLADGPGGHPVGTDFVSFWSTGRLVWAGDAAGAYDPDVLHEVQCDLLGSGCPFYGWLYPPPGLFMVATVAWLPYLSALTLWLVATGGLYVTAVHRFLPGRRAIVAAVASPAAWLTVGHGQNALLSAGIVGWGLSLLPRRPYIAGALLGLLVYKPQLALLVPVALVAARAWRALAAAGVSAISLCVLSLVMFGWDVWAGFLSGNSLARSVLEDGLVEWENMISTFAAARLLGAPVPLAWVLQAAVSAACVFAVWRLWRDPDSRHLPRTAGLIVAGLMATPFALDYDAVLLTIALAALAADGLDRGFGSWEVTTLAVAWVVPIMWRPLAFVVPLPWAQVTLCAVLWIALRRARPSVGAAA